MRRSIPNYQWIRNAAIKPFPDDIEYSYVDGIQISFINRHLYEKCRKAQEHNMLLPDWRLRSWAKEIQEKNSLFIHKVDLNDVWLAEFKNSCYNITFIS